MKEPLYKPEHWVIYQQGTTGGFGKITGGLFTNEAWHYYIAVANSSCVNPGDVYSAPIDNNATSVNNTVIIAESEVAYLFSNGSWLAPTHLGSGGASAYVAEDGTV